jgi:hypothetical protein
MTNKKFYFLSLFTPPAAGARNFFFFFFEMLSPPFPRFSLSLSFTRSLCNQNHE